MFTATKLDLEGTLLQALIVRGTAHCCFDAISDFIIQLSILFVRDTLTALGGLLLDTPENFSF